MRRWWAGILATIAAVPALAATAQAGPRQESLFQDDDLLLHAPPEAVDRSMRRLADLGVDRVRLSVIWRDIAPQDGPPADETDPGAYDPARLDPLDASVTAAGRHGIAVLLNVRGGAPEWAQGDDRPPEFDGEDAFRPDPAAFGRFTKMIARRYDGTYQDENAGGATLPRVSAWSIWNEPNWGALLQPQSERTRSGLLRPVAPRLYRQLFRAATTALHDAHHESDLIMLGETAPLGSSAPATTRSHLSPGVFLRRLFCLDAALRPLRGAAARAEGCDYPAAGPLDATAYAHHPYPVMDPPERPSEDPDHFRLADAPRLERVLDAARRHGRLRGKLPLFYTEFGYQTRPPDPVRGVTLGQQARWLARAEWMTFADPRVLGHTQFLLHDSGPNPGAAPGDDYYWSTYQTGLRYADGRPKPAYAVYRLPFVALDRVVPGRPVRLWGMVRGGRAGEVQTVRIEHRAPGGGWVPVQTLEVPDPKGYFTARVARAAAGKYRAAWVRAGAAVASAPASRKR